MVGMLVAMEIGVSDWLPWDPPLTALYETVFMCACLFWKLWVEEDNKSIYSIFKEKINIKSVCSVSLKTKGLLNFSEEKGTQRKL